MVDSRYDPAFQRGYASSTGIREPKKSQAKTEISAAAPAPESLIPAPSSTAPVTRAQEPAPAARASAPTPSVPATPAATHAGSPQTWGQPPEDSLDFAEYVTPKRRRNPWLITLWTVGIVALVLGIYGVFAQSMMSLSGGYYQESFPDTPNPWEPVHETLRSLSYPFTILGFLGVFAALAVNALRFDRIHAVPVPAPVGRAYPEDLA
ncbi:hypothetical protein [Mycetocola lacteus]|uniref:hypothetical protein n=1 Tax=Mycetocola lacteus TaxID=76637 RepID=UPI0011C3ECDD|nr:hypothetical protein [Mycetocola lacteus]